MEASFDALAAELCDLLRQYPRGISELDLIRRLQEQDHPWFPRPREAAHRDHALFQVHFRLFHTLYRLRDQGWERQAFHLEIGPLCIRLLPYQAGEATLAQPDPLRAYYLDLRHLEQTTAEQVDEMLGAFWVRMQGWDQRETALQTLGLGPEADYETARRRYRVLAMEHHPDRGGDPQRLQEINRAMDQLARAEGKARGR